MKKHEKRSWRYVQALKCFRKPISPHSMFLGSFTTARKYFEHRTKSYTSRMSAEKVREAVLAIRAGPKVRQGTDLSPLHVFGFFHYYQLKLRAQKEELH